MIKVLYIHGLGSSSLSSTGQYLETFNNEDIIFYHPSFDIHPLVAMEEINNFIKDNDINVVVGSSLGGFYALMSDIKYGIVINPSLTPITDIKTAIGYGIHNYTHNEGTYIIDDSFIKELETIIKRQYEDVDNWFYHFPKDRLFAGIFGNKDELFSHYDDFHSINSRYVVLIGDMGHKMSKDAFPVLMTLLEEIIKQSNK